MKKTASQNILQNLSDIECLMFPSERIELCSDGTLWSAHLVSKRTGDRPLLIQGVSFEAAVFALASLAKTRLQSHLVPQEGAVA